ncbi:MAG TPA: hypothetical protein VIY86_04305 [Pirellulaceae bacterium]
MPSLALFEAALRAADRRTISKLRDPHRIQEFLDGIEYSCVDTYRCPIRVLRERTGHCYDGAVFAAAMLRRLGQPAILLEMLSNGRDDGHVLALFRQGGHWGAVAKSNFTGLRFREPIHRSPRELIVSYFEQYYNLAREKTLAGYTKPLNLRRFERLPWMTEDGPLYELADALDAQPRYQLLTPAMARALQRVDELTYRAGMAGSNPAGLYQPTVRRRRSG